MTTLNNVLILGDSYSTLIGYIPENNRTYYGREDTALLHVDTVEKTWWDCVLKATSSTLLFNESFSGSTISYTGYEHNGKEFSKRASFITRLDNLIANGFFEKNRVDTVFIFGGTNDFWAGSPWGELTSEDFSEENLACVAPAYTYILRRLKQAAPNARRIGIINTEFSPEYTALLQAVLEKENAEYITLTYLEKQNGHPNVQGMQDIAKQVLQYLTK